MGPANIISPVRVAKTLKITKALKIDKTRKGWAFKKVLVLSNIHTQKEVPQPAISAKSNKIVLKSSDNNRVKDNKTRKVVKPSPKIVVSLRKKLHQPGIGTRRKISSRR